MKSKSRKVRRTGLNNSLRAAEQCSYCLVYLHCFLKLNATILTFTTKFNGEGGIVQYHLTINNIQHFSSFTFLGIFMYPVCNDSLAFSANYFLNEKHIVSKVAE